MGSGVSCSQDECGAWFEVPQSFDLTLVQKIKNEVLALHTDNIDDFYPQVILSYASGTRPGDVKGSGPGMMYVTGLLKMLNKEGIDAYCGLHAEVGENWKKFMLRIKGRRARGKVLVLILTKAFFQSKYCLQEVHAAVKKKMSLLPIRFEEEIPGADDQWKDHIKTDDDELMLMDVQNKLGSINSIPHPGTFLTQSGCWETIFKKLRKDVAIQGKGTFTRSYDMKFEYVGELINGKPNGMGKATFDDDCLYEGEFKDSLLHGRGKMTCPDAEYDGEWKEDMRHGRGKMASYKGEYDGEWKKDMRHGHGKLTESDGDVYDGEWKENMRHGHGKLTESDGDVYDGEWKDGKRQGRGKLTESNGDVYDGEWKDNKQNGRGKWIYDGNVYDGEWKDGRRQGRGKFTCSDGDVYDGEWKDGKPHGCGKETWSDGGVYDGEWKDGKRHGRGKLTWSDGTVSHDGMWENNKPVE